MDCYNRREMIKQRLRKEGKVSGAKLSEDLKVSKNTILKDINAITPNFPICTIYGRDGGYEYCGNGSTELNARQTKYLYEFMSRHMEEGDERFTEILNILKHAQPKDK